LINSPAFLADFFATGRATAVGRNPGSFAQFRGNGRVDISAESRAGTSGTVIYPNLDLNRGLTPLNVSLVDPSRRINQTCAPSGIGRTSSFTVTGRGGMPADPEAPLQSDAIVTDWVTVGNATKKSSQNRKDHPQQAEYPPEPANFGIEANGWTQADDGTIILVAALSNGYVINPALRPVNCQSKPQTAIAQ